MLIYIERLENRKLKMLLGFVKSKLVIYVCFNVYVDKLFTTIL